MYCRYRLTPLVLLLLLSLLLQPIVRADQPSFTIASYNVENLFDVFDDPYTLDELTPVKPRAKIALIAAAIRHMNPDVVALQEVENEGVLRAMIHEFLPDMGYEYVAVNKTNCRFGMNLGVMSRLPLTQITSYRLRELSLDGHDRSWSYARDLMHVEIQATADRRLDLFVVHFKSRLDSEADPKSESWRLAEATMSRRIIGKKLARDADGWVVVAGDFNDLPDGAVLKTMIGGGVSLIDAHSHLPAQRRITYLKPPYRSTIDYILVSPALSQRLIPSRSRVLADAELLAGSDHAPLSATFSME